MLLTRSVPPRIATLALFAQLTGISGVAAQQLDRSSFGLTSPTYTITFSEVALADGMPVTNQWSAFGLSLGTGVCIGSPFTGGSPLSTTALYNFSFLPDFSGCPGVGLSSIQFSTTLSGAAFHYITGNYSSQFTALLGGVVVSTFTTTADFDTNLWYGFENLSFDRIEILAFQGAFGLDDLQITSSSNGETVPEPGPQALVLTGLIALGVAARSSARRTPEAC